MEKPIRVDGAYAAPQLASFGADFKALIFGATGALGGAFADALLQQAHTLVTASRGDLPETAAARQHHFVCDIGEEASLAAMATAVSELAPFDLIINATGLLHDGAFDVQPEKAMRQISADAMARVFAVNAIGPALIMKYFLPLLARDKKAVMAHLSARVGSISDNRLGGWYSYRAAKSAQNMLVRTAAIEFARRAPNGVIVGLHPGTVDSNLSAPFQRGTSPDKVFAPARAVAHLLGVIENLTAADSGGVFAWDGARLEA
jgi:NAD(P)-dependent dehydrogenase (short-subunit alcohol dehydrogenase family)